MTGLRRYRFADAEPHPWRNGRGITRVLFDDATNDDVEAWSVRVSVADLTGSQSFSTFASIDRQLLALGPGGLQLTVGGRNRELTVGESYAFSGEQAASAQTQEPWTRVLNVMTRRGVTSAEIMLVRCENKLPEKPGPDAATTLLVAFDDAATIDEQPLERYDAVLVGSRDEEPRVSGRLVAIALSSTNVQPSPTGSEVESELH